MKTIFSRILFKNLPPRPFFAVNIPNGEIRERVYLTNRKNKFEISDRHNVVCQSPFSIAVWLPVDHAKNFLTGNTSLAIEKESKILAHVSLVQTNSYDQQNG